MAQSLLDYWTDRIESLPITLFLYDEYKLTEAISFIEQDRILALAKAELNIDILADLSDEYGFVGVEDVVNIDDLPHVVQAYPVSGNFMLSRFEISISRLKRLAGEDRVLYSEEAFHGTYLSLWRQRFVSKLFVILAALVLALLVFYSGRVYLISTTLFWSLYFDMGGTDKRYAIFLKESLLRVYFPLIMPVLVLYFLDYLEVIDYGIDPRIWLLMLVTAVIANQIAWLTYKEV